MKYDAIVLGLGATGSAAAYQLARRGRRVLGIDRHAPPHALGSTHGGTRITRLAIGEGEHYTPLAIRAHRIWREIEHETGANLLCTNGGLVISSADTRSETHVEGFFRNTVSAAQRFGIAHEVMDAAEIRRRYPQFAVGGEEYGYYEPSAGFVRPELCVHAQLELAKKYGAELHTGEILLGFEPMPAGVRVVTDCGRYECERLIAAAGAWLPALLGPPLDGLFRVHRQVQFWFAPRDGTAQFRPDRFPVFIWELRRSRQGIYGFPAIDGATGGIKIASESFETTTSPDTVDRDVAKDEIRRTHETLVAPYIPGISGDCVRASACLYTVTPDFGFVIDTHPQSERIIIASPCSGHGFKHSPAIGEGLAEWVCRGTAPPGFDAFALKRFSGRTA